VKQEMIMTLAMSCYAEARRKGRREGLREGRVLAVVAILSKMIGRVPRPTVRRIAALPIGQLKDLTAAMCRFSTPHDLQTWLARRASVPRRCR
jgi:hypothetical protein